MTRLSRFAARDRSPDARRPPPSAAPVSERRGADNMATQRAIRATQPPARATATEIAAEEAAARAAGERAGPGPLRALPDGVRLHTDAAAAQRAQALQARAFTFGDDVYFAAGRFAPDTPAGRALLAHELEHVQQQRRSGDKRIARDPDVPPDPQQQKERRYVEWVRYALVGALADQRLTVADFVAELLKQATLHIGDTSELGTFQARAAVLPQVTSPPWDLVNAPRLVVAVSGLPSELESDLPSVGTESFLGSWTLTIARYLAAPDDLQAQERFGELIDAVSGTAVRFGSVASLLWFELHETLMHLVELRQRLADLHEDPAATAATNLAKRRAVGDEINRTARHALLLDQAMKDQALVGTPLDPSSPTPLERQLGPLSGRLAGMRETEKTEAATQQALGAKPELLAATMPGGMGIEVAPEEAFPRTADEAAEKWSVALANRADEVFKDLETTRSKIVPATPPQSLDDFMKVFDSWFTFLPSRAIAADPAINDAMRGWRSASQGLMQLGFEGWMANQLLKPVGYSNYAMLALPKLWGPLGAPRLRDLTGAGLAPDYEFVHEFVPEYGAIETHAEDRQIALEQGIGVSAAAVRALWAMQHAGVPVLPAARAMQLAPPTATYLFLRDPTAAEGWHYLVYYESILDDSYKVAEQKTMAAPLAEYSGASAQAGALLAQTHHPKSARGAALGEKAIREHGIEGAEGRSQARYGLTAAPTNVTVDTARVRIEELRKRFDSSQLSAGHIIASLERSMSEGLARNDSPVFRVGATLYVAYREHDLKDVVLQYFEPKVLAEAVAQAVAISLLLEALALLGPIGRLLSGIIGKIMAKGGGSPLGTVLALVSWIFDAMHVNHFAGARAQAYFAVDVVDALAAFVQDKVVGGLAKNVRKWGSPSRWAPKTTREVSEAVKAWLEPSQLPIAHAEVKAARERLEKSKGANDPQVQALKALEADLGAPPPGEPHPAPVPVEKPTLASRIAAATETAKQAGLPEADVKRMAEQARSQHHADLKSAVEAGMGPVKPGDVAPPVEIVSADKIGPAGSKRTAKVVIENGKVTKILVAEDASPAAVYEEGVHAAQSLDPRMKKLFAQLDPGKPWAELTPKEKLAATKAAIQIEIDAKKRIAERLQQSNDPLSADELIRAYEDISNLRAKQLELAQIKPRKLGETNLPDILSEPATLYAKKTIDGFSIDTAWSQGTLSEFNSAFEKAHPNANLTKAEIDAMYTKAKRADNPNRVLRTVEKYDEPAKPGKTEELSFRTSGKRAEGDLLLTPGQRASIDKLIAARDRARRERADALAKNNDAAARRWDQAVRDASQKLGEQAADAWAKQRAWLADARPTKVYGGEGSRSGDFDRVDKWTDAKGKVHYLVIEAKGGASPLGGKWYKGKYVQQGSLAYFEAILDDMSRPTSSKESQQAAKELRAVLTTRKDLSGKAAEIHYEKVQIPVDIVDAPRTILKEKSIASKIEITPFDLK